jgi:hypothetical protein
MNDAGVNIETYEDLLAEKARLEVLIQRQKNIVRHDVDELRAEFKKEIRPVVETASFFKKMVAPEKRNQTILTTGASIAIDLAFTALLSKSNLVVRLLVPGIVKNYTSQLLKRLNPAKSKLFAPLTRSSR